MGEKKLLFSVTKDDFDFQYFRGSGNGGQKRNKTSNCCRAIHRESGARGECVEHREQHRNRQEAFKKCIDTPEFKRWHNLKTAYALKGISDMDRAIKKEIAESIKEENLVIEYYDPDATK